MIAIVGYGNSVVERETSDGQPVGYGNGFKRKGFNKIESKDGGLLRFLAWLFSRLLEFHDKSRGKRRGFG